jgi:hypothetical protein
MNLCDEVNHGPHKYVVDPFTHEVEVPAECGHVLLRTGAGATWADKPEVAEPDEFCRMRHATDHEASFSFRGVTYSPGADGVVTVPAAAVPGAIAHGFTGPLIET